MTRRAVTSVLAVTLVGASALLVAAAPAPTPPAKWPPWLSIESPVNPFDPATRGAALLVHTALRDAMVQASDLSGSAEGIVNGTRRTVTLHFDGTPLPGVFALRRQWPADGTWLLRISLRTTTAIVTLNHAGEVASVAVPTTLSGADRVPRAVASREIDSVLAEAVKR
jgi:hypothetical protein